MNHRTEAMLALLMRLCTQAEASQEDADYIAEVSEFAALYSYKYAQGCQLEHFCSLMLGLSNALVLQHVSLACKTRHRVWCCPHMQQCLNNGLPRAHSSMLSHLQWYRSCGCSMHAAICSGPHVLKDDVPPQQGGIAASAPTC